MLPTPPAPARPDESELLQQLLARDERALREVYVRYGQALLTALRRVVRDEELARDVLQESLLKIWAHIDSYDAARGRLFTWMARLCCNQAIDALRSPRYRTHSGRQAVEDTPAAQNQAAPPFHPEYIGLRELTLQLKPRQREVIDLLYFGGRTQVEAAEELGIPLATVKTRARAAMVIMARWAHCPPARQG